MLFSLLVPGREGDSKTAGATAPRWGCGIFQQKNICSQILFERRNEQRRVSRGRERDQQTATCDRIPPRVHSNVLQNIRMKKRQGDAVAEF